MSAPVHDRRPSPAGFWIGLVIGGAVMAYGVRGALEGLGAGNPTKLAFWVVGLDLAHDLVLAPLVVVVGLVLGRLVPTLLRGPVRIAAALSGLVVLFSWPLIRAFGRRPGNSSTLPLDYAHSVLVVLAGIWLVAAAVVAVRWRRGAAAPTGARSGHPDPRSATNQHP
ncbi:MAG: hypothetical protein ACXV5S_00760 [Acidimicrobiales bacterium]